MENLYAPWRSPYVKNAMNSDLTECAFCSHFNNNNDTDSLILRRSAHTIVMLNLYPYNAGHLLILPLAHASKLTDITIEARTEIMELINYTNELLVNVLEADGINTGFNIGKAAGASIPGHLHVHVLPRWVGDTNFLPLLAETKQISVNLIELYDKLKPYFEKLTLSI